MACTHQLNFLAISALLEKNKNWGHQHFISWASLGFTKDGCPIFLDGRLWVICRGASVKKPYFCNIYPYLLFFIVNWTLIRTVAWHPLHNLNGFHDTHSNVDPTEAFSLFDFKLP